MDRKQKGALRRHRINITEDLEPDEVLDYLNQDGVLTENDCELVSSGKTRKERCQLLLSLLPCRGPGAYGSFRHALSEARYRHIADLLNLSHVSDTKDTTFVKGSLDYETNEKETPHGNSEDTTNPNTCDKCQQILEDIPHNTPLSQILSQHCCLILDNVEPTDLIDHHYQDGVLSDDEYERIRAGTTRRDRCKTLFMELAKQTSEKVVPTFQKSLAKKYKFILDQIHKDAQKVASNNFSSMVGDLGDDKTRYPQKFTSARVNDQTGPPVPFSNEMTDGSVPFVAHAHGGENSNLKMTYPRRYTGTTCIKSDSDTDLDAFGQDKRKKLTSIRRCKSQTQSSLNDSKNYLKINRRKRDTHPANLVDGRRSVVSVVKSVASVHHETPSCRRLSVAFNYLSTLINQGSYDKFESVSSNLQRRHFGDPDMHCLLAYLHASRDLFKNDFDAAKQHIENAFKMVPKTTDPKYFTVELFTVKTRMYITQKKLDKLENALEDVKQIIESDPYGCTGRAAGWLYMNDGRSKTAQMTTLNQRSPNYLSVHNHLSVVARESFHRALVNFQRDGGKDGPFGCGYALCRLAILLLKCGDNGLTMNTIRPSKDDIKTAGDYLRKLEDSDIPIPKILEVHYLLAKCDYQFRRNNTVRALEYANNALELATQINMLEFTEHARNRVMFLKMESPPLIIKEVTEKEALEILLGESSITNSETQEE